MGVVNWLKERGSKAQEASEAPKAEAAEVKSAKETGKERVGKIVEAAKALWGDLRGKLASGLDRAKKGAVDAIFIAVGGAEKGGKATVKSVESGAKFAKESVQEVWELGQIGAKATKEAARKTKEAAIDAGLTGAALAFMAGEAGVHMARELKKKGLELKDKAAKEVVDAAVALTAMGVGAVEAVRTFGAEQMTKAYDAARRAKEAGIDWSANTAVAVVQTVLALEQRGVDFKKAVEAKGTAWFNKGVEIYGKAREGAKDLARRGVEAFGRMMGRVGVARDTFYAKANEQRMRLAGTAELKGQVESLREEVQRLSRMIEAQQALQAVEPENVVWDEADEDKKKTQEMTAVAS